MARYGRAFRDRIVARLLPPENAAIDVVSREVGVSVGTLERWRAQALAAPGELASSQRWTPAARLEAVIATARRRVKELERELHRKDKALAETAALLVLRKKLDAVFRDGEDA